MKKCRFVLPVLAIVVALAVPAVSFAHVMPFSTGHQAASKLGQRLVADPTTPFTDYDVLRCVRSANGHRVSCNLYLLDADGGGCMVRVTTSFTSRRFRTSRTSYNLRACGSASSANKK
jgi:hypothetical protein